MGLGHLGNGILRNVLAYATFAGVTYTVWTFWRFPPARHHRRRERRAASVERKEIAKVPASFLSRAEIVGLIGQAAAGQRLDFSGSSSTTSSTGSRRRAPGGILPQASGRAEAVGRARKLAAPCRMPRPAYSLPEVERRSDEVLPCRFRSRTNIPAASCSPRRG